MTLLEILLLLIITYGLLAGARRKQPAKPQPERTTPSKRDLALEEALREIREALGEPMRRPTSEQKREARPVATETEFRSLEQPPGPEFYPLESTLDDTAPQEKRVLHAHSPALDQPLETHHFATPSRQAQGWLRRLRHRKGVREAMVLAELLGPPRARRPWRPRPGSNEIGLG